MDQKIILIRGNSGSGKSTVANRVRDELSGKAMFLQQDILRRNILKIEDKEGNPCVGLIENLVLYGKSLGYDIVLEGILSKKKYGDMLHKILNEFDKAYVYYFDISFDETLRRHKLREKSVEFGESEMSEWWKEKDYLGVPSEVVFHDNMTEDDLVKQILYDVSLHGHILD